ncbi:MAG: pitrilysin family protein [Vicinamibacterales bacterium]
MIVREVLDSGVRLVTEAMPHVRSVSIAVWLTRGSRHESDAQSGIAHFVEHMLFKGTTSRSAEDIAQTIDSIGGQLDAFTSKEYAAYYIKVLDEHLPLALDVLSDMVLHPAFAPDDIEREKKVILEEIKMVEDTPDDLVHELFTQGYWDGHPLGRPILGTKETVESFSASGLRAYFDDAYVAPNFIVAAAGNVRHEDLRTLVNAAFAEVTRTGGAVTFAAPAASAAVQSRNKDIEQSHICLGVGAYQQNHDDRHTTYVLNTILGGSMSSRLFQNIREKRGLAYAVFSSLAAYRDAGMMSVYAGCATEAIDEVVGLVVDELRTLRTVAVEPSELRRAKDHLKGSLMLSLESTSSRMSQLARQDIYFEQHFTLDETLEGIERVSIDDVRRVAHDLFRPGTLAATVLGPIDGFQLSPTRLDIGA